MSALYGSLAHPGAATAEALQHAQVELIHPRWPAGSPYAHPYYWAGFTLVSNRP
jgi:CHAT domain-containing protein